jgi:putative tricarboxylic transport membrane protein
VETIQNLIFGFSVILNPIDLGLCLIGVFLGTLIGVLPGIGPAGCIALMLPFTFSLPPVSAVILLSGIFYGSMFGGSTTSILVNIPGEAASVITCIDGYQMAKKGRAGRALGIAAIGSFIAGTIGVILLMLVAPPLADFAVKFGPSEFFALIFLGLTMLVYLSSGSKIKSFTMAALGTIIGMIGNDVLTGFTRFTFGIKGLYDGPGLVPVLMGLFGVGEVLINIEGSLKREIFETKIKGLLPDKDDWRNSIMPITRGSFLGFFLGILPGPGNIISTFISYGLEKRISKTPDRFGQGAIEGVAGPESANNSATVGAFIPLLTLGIPTGATMALIMGAFIIHGITPGPLLIKDHPEVFWGVVTSMYLGNLFLLILNLPLVGLWVKILKVPYGILFPLIFLFCLIGAFAGNMDLFDINVMIVFGIIGYILRKADYDPTPLVFAYILLPMWEENFRQSMVISYGDLLVFFKNPISATLLAIGFLIIVLNFIKGRKGKKSLYDPKTA